MAKVQHRQPLQTHSIQPILAALFPSVMHEPAWMKRNRTTTKKWYTGMSEWGPDGWSLPTPLAFEGPILYSMWMRCISRFAKLPLFMFPVYMCNICYGYGCLWLAMTGYDDVSLYYYSPQNGHFFSAYIRIQCGTRTLWLLYIFRVSTRRQP